MNRWIEIYQNVNTLKDQDRVRRGWIARNVPGRLESVAEHCFAMSNMAILLNIQYNLNLDMNKVLTMINIHEYGEIEVGDIIPDDGISKDEKYQKELNSITKLLKDNPQNQIIIDLWKEFESLETDEAIFVYLLDKFQSVLQAKEYSEKHNMPELYEEFLNWYNNSVLTKIKAKNNNLTRILTPHM